ncbi:autotransporter outer membrane beta-barrel domain-containing protein [Achromobacter sp. SIMBA_011]|uniref:autotransporter outer membrane beta-barrel domain-containing protein n=1 Tax=Achromobacter sp. SIMBA_011 TaxID=3085759 RepID=UPI00397B7A0F
MSKRELIGFRPSVVATAVAAVFCTASGPALADPVAIANGTHDFSGAGHENNWIEQTGGTVNLSSGVFGSDGAASAVVRGGQINIGSGASLKGMVALHGDADANIGVNARDQVTIRLGVHTNANNTLALDNVFLNEGSYGSVLSVQGTSTATTTARTRIHGSGAQVGVILTGASSLLMNGSTIDAEDSAIKVRGGGAQASFLTMNDVSSTGGISGLYAQTNSVVQVNGGTLKASGVKVDDFGGVNNAGVFALNDGAAGDPRFRTVVSLSNVAVIGEGPKSAGLLSQAVNGNVEIGVLDSSIKGGKYGVVFNVDPFYAKDLMPATSTVVLTDTTVTAGEGPAVWVVGKGAMANMLVQGQKSTLTGANGVALQTDAGGQIDLRVADANVRGDAINNGGISRITLDRGAVWQGATQGVTRMDVRSGGVFALGGSSTVSTLAMNGGTVDLGGGAGGAFHTLTVNDLSGGGMFRFGTDLSQPAAPVGDKLIVKNQATGSYQVRVADSGREPGGGDAKPLTLVETGGGGAKFSLDNPDGVVNQGVYQYRLGQNPQNGNNWELQPTGQTTPYTNSVVNIMGVAPTIWYGQLMTVRERFGELGFEQDRGGVWVRPYGTEYKIKSASGARFQQNQSGVAVGADKAVDFLGGKTYFGALFNYSESKLDDKAGAKGTVDAYSIGAYATWMGRNGYYLHGLVNANRYISKARASTSNGGSADGSFNTNGVGVSLEGGRRFDFDNRWFVQPYGQLSALHMQGSRFSLNNGMDAKGDSMDSVQAAIGTQVGRAFRSANGDVVEPYVRVAVVHEFVKSNDISINDHSFNADLSGSRVELGLGTALQIGKHLSAHLDYAYANGRKLSQPFLLNAGLRYQW